MRADLLWINLAVSRCIENLDLKIGYQIEKTFKKSQGVYFVNKSGPKILLGVS